MEPGFNGNDYGSAQSLSFLVPNDVTRSALFQQSGTGFLFSSQIPPLYLNAVVFKFCYFCLKLLKISRKMIDFLPCLLYAKNKGIHY